MDIYKSLGDQLGLNEHYLNELISISEIRKFKKNALILDSGSACNWVATILDGAVRTFVINNKGEEISYLLQVNKDYIGDYESFIKGKKSGFTIQACLETTCLFIYKDQLSNLVEKDIFWLKFLKEMSDFSFLDAKRRIDELLFYTPEMRYLNLLAKAPEIIRKIPQKYISSYLGITPQSLSRIKNRIS